jgi:hypothetical protein
MRVYWRDYDHSDPEDEKAARFGEVEYAELRALPPKTNGDDDAYRDSPTTVVYPVDHELILHNWKVDAGDEYYGSVRERDDSGRDLQGDEDRADEGRSV